MGWRTTSTHFPFLAFLCFCATVFSGAVHEILQEIEQCRGGIILIVFTYAPNCTLGKRPLCGATREESLELELRPLLELDRVDRVQRPVRRRPEAAALDATAAARRAARGVGRRGCSGEQAAAAPPAGCEGREAAAPAEHRGHAHSK